MVNSPIYNYTLFVPDPEQTWKKIRVSILILQMSIRDVHNDLISESCIYQLKEETYETIGNPLISDTALHAVMLKNVRKMTSR